MRARDSKDDSKKNEESSNSDDQKGGLFGSIQLKPEDGPGVPPPPDSGIVRRPVPSLEEARAELDRIRAESNQQSSGLFHRNKMSDDAADETPRAAPGSRESATFGAVSLPPRGDDEDATSSSDSPTQTTFASTTSPRDEAENMPPVSKPSGKSFRVPSLSQFDDSDDGEEMLAQEAPAAPTQSSEEQAVYAPVAANEPRPSSEDQTVTESTPPAERQVIARTPPLTVTPPEIVSSIESLRSADPQLAEPARTETALSTPINEAETVAPTEERSASRPANTSNMTPFQRLMAARAAQGGSPISRSRAERPAPVAPTPPRPSAEVQAPEVQAPEVQAPEVQAPQIELPQQSAPQMEVLEVELPDAELSQADAPQTAIPELDALPLPAIETPVVSALDEPSAPIELPASRMDAEVAPLFEEAALTANAETDFARANFDESEASVVESSVPMPEVETQLSAPAVNAEAEMPEAEMPEVEAPEAEMADAEMAEAEMAEAEMAEVEAPEAEMPEVEAPEAEMAEVEAPEVEAPEAEMPEAEMPDAEMPEVEVPEVEISDAEVSAVKAEVEVPGLEAPASRLGAFGARFRRPEVSETAESDAEEGEAEAEIVPEENSIATASTEAESSPEMPPSTADNEVRPVLSLAERLARAPRAELDAAHAEAQSLAPEILDETTNKRESISDALGRPAASLSFAERLAARNRPPIEEPPASTQPVEPSFAPPAPIMVAPPAPEVPAVPAEQTPFDEPPRRAVPRTFSERLAARTSLDRHLQVPSEEPTPTSQDLATHNTELARINEGAELSEREMRNRVLFRQKHLIFDAVIGSIDQRTMQNPTRETVKPQIEKGVDAALREFNLDLEQSERNWLVDEFVRETTDLGALVPLLEDPSVSKVVVTGANDVSVERLGRIERTGVSFRDDDHLLSLVRRIAELSGGRVDSKVPLLDRPLPDGGRIRAKVPPLAPQPTLTIEKSTGNPFVLLKRQMEEKSRGDALPYAQLRERIQQRLLREFEGDAAALAGDQDKLRLQVEEMIGNVIAEEHVAVTRAERASLVMDLLNEIVGLGPIEPLLNDPDVDEVMVNGPYQIYVERKGKIELTTQRFRDNAHVMQVIDRIVAPLGRRVDEKSPMVDGRLRDGSRFNAIIPPLALSGPTMTIRKFARDPFTMSDLINFGTMTREAAQFLQAAVEGRLNIVVSGGTGSGKTTTLNVLSSFIPSTERIVTIEDAAELQMRQEHVIRMETRPANIEGVGEVSIRDLVKNSLRMRPDRIVVGECRGGEALDMLQAMNTGHDGSLTTAHSNGPRDTCKRLETMVMMAGFDLPIRAIREQISMAVQLVVHQERMRDGKRRITAITEIVGMEGDVLTLQDIFRFDQEGIDDDGRIMGSLHATGMRPKSFETIIDNGGQLSMDVFTPKPQEVAPRSRMTERGGR